MPLTAPPLSGCSGSEGCAPWMICRRSFAPITTRPASRIPTPAVITQRLRLPPCAPASLGSRTAPAWRFMPRSNNYFHPPLGVPTGCSPIGPDPCYFLWPHEEPGSGLTCNSLRFEAQPSGRIDSKEQSGLMWRRRSWRIRRQRGGEFLAYSHFLDDESNPLVGIQHTLHERPRLIEFDALSERRSDHRIVAI